MAVSVDRRDLEAICDRLRTLLEADDAEAADVMEAHASLLHAGLGEHYRATRDGIRAFDFATALSELNAATLVGAGRVS
jgi:hypothetical protein